MGDLSPHFSKSEFACRCCAKLHVQRRLIDALEELRMRAGKPILVHDGYRCPEHNQQVGGVTNSEHVRGMAADIEVNGLTLQEMYELALQVPDFAEGGIGVYDGGFLHVDVRPHASRWARVRGQYVGIQHLIEEPIVLAQKSSATDAG